MSKLLVAVVAATFLLFSAAVAQTPSMVPSTCMGSSGFGAPMIPGTSGPMMSPICAGSGSGPPPSCSNSLDLSKTCNSANLDLL